ncbi:PGR5-like protein 1A, chloroplastic isoform X1 [Musa acuminata AAA Group]|uniref:PGR5-like protein 1A, chloroplastic isoform X1 n=1 Tax=Musa acuminata AAA Group TaxID=214697 RepID=UPI0031D419DC
MPPPSSSSSFTAAVAAPALCARRQARRFFSSDSRLRPRTDRRRGQWPLALAFTAQGPCCLYVGPVETASKEMLEALYQQARDSYYSGNPLIVDDMFDKVELKLRLYGSKSVVKYPRCSLRQHSTYSDAEEDPSQAFALASVWMLLLAFGTSAILVPTIYSLSLALSDIFNLRYFFYGGRSLFELFMMVNGFLIMGLGCLIGYPIASASVQALQGLWRKELVALKGSCPNCGEEVFAFVKSKTSYRHPHRAECHVCECTLEFRTKVEETFSTPGRRWVYGRVYLVQ